MEMGMLLSLRMVVLMGAIRSTRPVTTEAPDDVLSSTRSPTTKGRDTNYATHQMNMKLAMICLIDVCTLVEGPDARCMHCICP